MHDYQVFGPDMPTPAILWAEVQFLDFTTEPGMATLWDEQAEDGSRIPVKLGADEYGVVHVWQQPRTEVDHQVDRHYHRIGHD